MPPKKGTKRKAAAKDASANQNGDVDLSPPSRDNWTGWVEMESEPAFFNVMLKDMGIRGVRIHEVYSMDPNELVLLPQPVHAFIFCFHCADTEMTQQETECPSDVWFANQIPDFACASVALLNIVNNINGLIMGKEMRDFKDFTKDLDPMARGDAIDNFDFLRRIHNSFARETDILTVDMVMQNRIGKAKKRQAAVQAQATKKAKNEKNAFEPEKKRADSAVATSTRTSKRAPKAANKKKANADSDASSPLSEPPESDGEYKSTGGNAKKSSSSPSAQATRRSARQPKPRKDPNKLFSEADPEQEDEVFHFVAYVPINGKVWKMDGLDSYPHLVGEFDATDGGVWTNVAEPDILATMSLLPGDIKFNLMAVAHDPSVEARADLAANVRELQTIDARLDEVCKDWRDRAGAETDAKGLLLGPDASLDLTDADLAAASVANKFHTEFEHAKDEYVDELLRLRRQHIEAQAPLRGSVRLELLPVKDDDKKARLARHDFGGLIRGWMGALAEQQELKDLVDDAV